MIRIHPKWQMIEVVFNGIIVETFNRSFISIILRTVIRFPGSIISFLNEYQNSFQWTRVINEFTRYIKK